MVESLDTRSESLAALKARHRKKNLSVTFCKGLFVQRIRKVEADQRITR